MCDRQWYIPKRPAFNFEQLNRQSAKMLVFLIFILTACGSNLGVIPTHDPNIPKSLQATDGDSGVFTVEFPGVWVGIETSGGTVNIGNKGLAIRNYESGIENLSDEQVAGTVSAVIKAALPEAINADDIADVTRYVAARIAIPQSDMTYTFGSVMVEDGIAYTDGLGTGEGATLDVRVLLVDVGEVYGILFFAAPITQLEPHFDTLNTIAASFSFINAQDFLATQEWENP